MTAIAEIADWRSGAACMSADPDMFFPISAAGPALGQVERAKAICAGCRVRRECLEFALANQVHGVWGGTTDEDRRRLRRRLVRSGPVAGRLERQAKRGQRPPGR